MAPAAGSGTSGGRCRCRAAPLRLLLALAAAAAAGGAAGEQPPWAAPGLAWQYQLGEAFAWPGSALPGVGLYSIDLESTSAATVAAMRAAGAVPVCYFSTQYEAWREDAASFAPADIGAPLDGWPGEAWVDTRSAGVREIMRQRIARCAAKGFVAVDPDNTDGYEAATGFPLSAATALDYLTFLSQAARAAGLGVGLKNTLGLVTRASVESLWDFAINEQCHQYRECGRLAPFADAGRPIFNVEYAWKGDNATLQAGACAQAVGSYPPTNTIGKALALRRLPWVGCALPGGGPPAPASPRPPPPGGASPSPSPGPAAPPPSPPPSPAPGGGCGQGVGVPLYVDPCDGAGCAWTAFRQGLATPGGPRQLVILNPNNGPGAAKQGSYARLVAELHGAGVTTLGYVSTRYGRRDAAAARRDVSRWLSWYPELGGIFLDEGSDSCARRLYYQALVRRMHAAPGAAPRVAALNWGTDGPACYLDPSAPGAGDAFDLVVNFEGSYASYARWTPAPWTAGVPRERLWHLVHSAPPGSLAPALALSKERRAGWVFVTPDALPGNPWDSLPRDWAAQLAGAADAACPARG
ncbi:Spherulin-4 [Scenedesmus sp. PABB004]|nr:Spherulin-4 [Scenedesmus sp. PABB004]